MCYYNYIIDHNGETYILKLYNRYRPVKTYKAEKIIVLIDILTTLQMELRPEHRLLAA